MESVSHASIANTTTGYSRWQYFEPKFEYEAGLDDRDQPWAGHKQFAYDLIRNFKPATVVELGTHWGTSFFAMSQGVKDAGLRSELTAIDTWHGDKHAGVYGEEVFEKVNELRSRYYPRLQIKLLRSTFDEALNQFADGTINLLHIDGLHTYDAVKHDFNNWLPKVSPKGIIIFHDTHELNHDFGVYKLWAELKKNHPTLEFNHSHGLGILFLDRQTYSQFAIDSTPWGQYYQTQSLTRQAELAAETTARLESGLKEEQRRAKELLRELALTEENRELERKIEEMKRHVINLETILGGIDSSKVFRLLLLPGSLRKAFGGKR